MEYTLHRACNKCKKDKPVSDFYRRSDKPNLYRAVCKACMAVNDSRTYADRAEYLRTYQRNYRRKTR